jgi:hypothetical protein
MNAPEYELELRLNGVLIGDVRKLAQNLVWERRRTINGVDSISFTLNDILFEQWCNDRSTSIVDVLKPLALDCRVIRNGVAVCGGFLATMPAYTPNGTSANLDLQFDGYLNLLGGVYIRPTATTTAPMADMIEGWIYDADSRAEAAGKGFGFVSGDLDNLATVTQTIDGYKTVKEAITDRADNITGAGIFDVYFHPDRTYDIKSDANFGLTRSYIINYPTMLNGISAVSISAQEVDGFASHVIAIGAGEVSADAEKNTAIVSESTNSDAVAEYGYFETLYQDSSSSRQETLDGKAESQVASQSNPLWQPEITLSGRQIAPSPEGDDSIWIGDRITINNTEDMTGQTSGQFRVQALSVSVTSSNAENITPVLERIV